jgi:hypothetical protein
MAKRNIGDEAIKKKIPKKSSSSKSLKQAETRIKEEEERRHWILEAAYYRAERRGFTPGYELEDWLAAEAEIDGSLRNKPLF